jgi:hypothetical protein
MQPSRWGYFITIIGAGITQGSACPVFFEEFVGAVHHLVLCQALLPNWVAKWQHDVHFSFDDVRRCAGEIRERRRRSPKGRSIVAWSRSDCVTSLPERRAVCSVHAFH